MTASSGIIRAPVPTSRVGRCIRLLDVALVEERQSVTLVGRLEGPGVGPPSELFFRFPAEAAPLVGLSGDPFLAALLVPAMVAGASLEIDAPVSRRLLRRTTQIQDIFTAWYPERHRVEITAPVRGDTASRFVSRDRGVGAFYSGGIDSCYTLLKNQRGWPSVAEPITHLIFGKGFDARLTESAGLAESERHLRAMAADAGKTLVVVETNLRDVARAPWAEMFHGAALAATAHCLAPALHTVLIPSSYTYNEIGEPWGSHPLLDELWSTEMVQLLHDGAEASRIDKLAALLEHAPGVVDRLRVCYTGAAGGPRNCGQCRKCVRVMVMLRALGKLGATRSFPGVLPPDYLERYSTNDLVILPAIIAHARARGDDTLARILDRRRRQLVWKAGLPRMLRAHPLGAALMDARAAMIRRWRERAARTP
jgi:hypothetical protein